MTHPAIAPLSFLVGSWSGSGRGVYPTIQPFDYEEHVEIAAMPTPVLRYGQRTTVDGQPRHAESGWLRLPDTGPEMVIAQPTGVVEAHIGTLDGQVLDLASTAVATTPSAAGHRITAVRRRIAVEGDVLRYELHMAAVGQPLQLHLSAELHRTG